MEYNRKYPLIIVMIYFFIAIGCAGHFHKQWKHYYYIANAIDSILTSIDRSAIWSVQFKEIGEDNIVYQVNSHICLLPASNVKLFTTATALRFLTADYEIATPILTDGDVDTNGILIGNLYILGSGDPTIGGRFYGNPTLAFRQWSEILKDMGIKKISGDIIGVDTIFTSNCLEPTWEWGDLAYYYATRSEALIFNENCLEVELIADMQTDSILCSWIPALDYITLKLDIDVMDSGSQCEIAWRWETPDSMLFVSGKMAEGRIEKLRIPVENPSSYFLRSLKSIFTKEGIETTGEVRILDLRQEDLSKTKFKTIFSHYSPPLSEIVRIANTESVNLYAEQLLRLIGFKLYLKGSPEAGIDGIESLFAEAGINLNEVHLVDGCGLSRHNWVSAQAFVSLLEYCRYCDFYEVWFNSLPAYGEGTLQYRSLSEIPAEICAKTGSMEGVRALSGYAFVKDKEYAFSFICNNYQCPSTKIEDTIDKVISYILMKQ